MIVDVTTRTPSETERLARRLAQCVRAPLVLLLDGDLGAGKTTFTRGFVGALSGAKGVVVQSPTFALARTYPTSPRVHHVDLYRLESGDGHAADIEALGLLDMLSESDAFSLVEWPRDVDAQLAGLVVGRVQLRDSGRGREVRIDVPDVALADVDAFARLAKASSSARATRASDGAGAKSAKSAQPKPTRAPTKRSSTSRRAKSKRSRPRSKA